MNDGQKTRTPGPWFVRKRERDGEVLDCFVAAPDVLGFAYDAEILGDDEYRDGIERKIADAEFIVQCVNEHDGLIETLRIAADVLRKVGPSGDPSSDEILRDTIRLCDDLSRSPT